MGGFPVADFKSVGNHAAAGFEFFLEFGLIVFEGADGEIANNYVSVGEIG